VRNASLRPISEKLKLGIQGRGENASDWCVWGSKKLCWNVPAAQKGEEDLAAGLKALSEREMH
jgi:hypothetical protein